MERGNWKVKGTQQKERGRESEGKWSREGNGKGGGKNQGVGIRK